MTEQIWWYVARSSGIVALALVLGAVVMGLLMSTGLGARMASVPWILAVHRFLGGLALAFIGVHLVGLWLHDYIHFGPAELLVPLASSFKPWAVALGVLSLYLTIAIQATALAMKRLPVNLWRTVHLLSFGLFWVAALHGLLVGTDATSPWFRWPLVAALVAIGGLSVVRAGRALAADDRRRSARPHAPAVGAQR